MDTIRSEAEKDANENAEESEAANLVTGTSPLPNNETAIVRKDLKDDNPMSEAFATEDDYPPIVPRSPQRRSTSPESSPKPIRFEKNKTAKQSRKPTASTKIARGKQTLKRSKQARVSVADNSGLDTLQQTLSDYFKGQMQSTRDLPRQQSPTILN